MVRRPLFSWHQSLAILQSHPDLLAARKAAGGPALSSMPLGPSSLWPRLERGLRLGSDLVLPTPLSAFRPQGQVLAESHQTPLATEQILGQTSPSFFAEGLTEAQRGTVTCPGGPAGLRSLYSSGPLG